MASWGDDRKRVSNRNLMNRSMTIDKSLLFCVAKDAVISVEWVANTDEKIVNFIAVKFWGSDWLEYLENWRDDLVLFGEHEILTVECLYFVD